MPEEHHASIAVIGSGTLGAQIAFTMAARGGHSVKLFDSNPEAVRRALDQMADPNLTAVPTLELAVSGVELVIEAIPEDLALKRELFAQISRLTESAILATNSSSIRSRLLADVTLRPNRLMNLHFFLEPWKRNVVELMTCGQTDEAVFQRVSDIMRLAMVEPIRVGKESMGFLYNRIWRSVKKETLRVFAEGVGRAEEIDHMWRVVMASPAGPCETMDAIGLDVVLAIERLYAEESGDPADNPPPFLEEWVRDGRLGQKSGRGFYDYPDANGR